MSPSAPQPTSLRRTGPSSGLIDPMLVLATFDVELNCLDHEHNRVAARLGSLERQALLQLDLAAACSLADCAGTPPSTAPEAAALKEQLARIERASDVLCRHRDRLLDPC